MDTKAEKKKIFSLATASAAGGGGGAPAGGSEDEGLYAGLNYPLDFEFRTMAACGPGAPLSSEFSSLHQRPHLIVQWKNGFLTIDPL